MRYLNLVFFFHLALSKLLFPNEKGYSFHVRTTLTMTSNVYWFAIFTLLTFPLSSFFRFFLFFLDKKNRKENDFFFKQKSIRITVSIIKNILVFFFNIVFSKAQKTQWNFYYKLSAYFFLKKQFNQKIGSKTFVLSFCR